MPFSQFIVVVSASQRMFAFSLAGLTEYPINMVTKFGELATFVSFVNLAGPPTVGTIIDRAGGHYTFAEIWGKT